MRKVRLSWNTRFPKSRERWPVNPRHWYKNPRPFRGGRPSLPFSASKGDRNARDRVRSRVFRTPRQTTMVRPRWATTSRKPFMSSCPPVPAGAPGSLAERVVPGHGTGSGYGSASPASACGAARPAARPRSTGEAARAAAQFRAGTSAIATISPADGVAPGKRPRRRVRGTLRGPHRAVVSGPMLPMSCDRLVCQM